MQRSAFKFELPAELIAQHPTADRRGSRLLQLDGNSGELTDLQFPDIRQLLRPDDLLVLNNTKVIPARLHGKKASGGAVEVLIERVLDDQRALAHIRASKAPKPGNQLVLEEELTATMVQRHEALFELDFSADANHGGTLVDKLQQFGHMPLPPYINRADTQADQQRYQTVFAQTPGAVAAPTAGLHFDQELLDDLEKLGVKRCEVTLHVGAGTFQPVRADSIHDHVMHKEWLEVSAKTVEQIKHTQQQGGRIIAVGTTAVRALETAAANGELQPYSGDSQLFLFPGRPFHVVDAMLTNFHLSESTLLMLVCAFAGYQRSLHAYQHAIEQRYRFFSYGDAMFISRNPNAAQDVPA